VERGQRHPTDLPTPIDVPAVDAKYIEQRRTILADILDQLLPERRRYHWGDLDPHGFVILHRLRRCFPHTTSLLMDRATLLNHRDRRGREPRLAAEDLPTLDDDEEASATQFRLEQEFIRYSAVTAALHVLAR
jgi:hypothetical protein